MKKVFLITKLKTTNIGNEALSTEIMNLFSQEAKDITLYVNGRPFGLDGYYPKRIVDHPNPVSVLDTWAKGLAGAIQKEADVSFTNRVPRVSLLKADSSDFKNEGWKAKLRPLKRWLVSFRAFAPQYAERARILKQADWLIYSGAGEVGDNIVFLRQLVELRAAQMLGIQTAAVNQSVVIKTPVFQKLVGHVYEHMKHIVIRGETTRKNLVSYGVPDNIIEVAPDSAINAIAQTKPAQPRNQGIVAFNLTPRIQITEEQIASVIQHLRSLGKEVRFVTNEPYEDGKMAKLLMEKFQVPSLGSFSAYDEYVTALSNCDFVISARLHTNMLSLVSHTPIIPIEGNVFKTTELLQQLQYPLPTLVSTDNGWVGKLISHIDLVDKTSVDFNHYFQHQFPGQKLLVKRNAAWLNNF